MQPTRIPTRSRSALLLGLTVVAAGCGGATTGRRAEPKLHQRDAAQLVALAQQVARDAPADGCAAQRDIAALRTKADALVAAGRVPLRLRAQLLAGVAAVAADAPACAPPAPTPAPHPAPRPHEKPKKHEPPHGHDKGHEKDH